ncbi:bifunctional RimM [Babesia duncani]|uniref:Bifunctional RimM n=1 Tax=Babesia duncani TaxID=323732 RepID=A0AAD9PKI4_9APIC|nr:bifunctional RimM [Babesia duncani]
MFCNVNNSYYPRSKFSKVGYQPPKGPKLTQMEKLQGKFDLTAPRIMPPEMIKKITESQKISKPKLPSRVDESLLIPPPQAADEKRLVRSKCPNAIEINPSLIFSTPLDDHIVLGEIGSPHGLKGHVKVKSLTTRPMAWLCQPGFRYLKNMHDGHVIPIKLESGRLVNNEEIYVLKFEGIDCREHALRLMGCYLTTQLQNVPPLEEDCYYSRDLLECNVYLFNDDTKTLLGKAAGFLHRTRLVNVKKYANLTEDLLEVEMDIRLSLLTLINLTKNRKIDQGAPSGVSLVTSNDLEEAEVINAEQELCESMTGVHYVKYFVCSDCKAEFTKYDVAVAHEMAGCSNGPEANVKNFDSELKATTIDEVSISNLKRPIRRFYVPLVKNETIRCVDAPNKSIYIDPYTIFIGEDGQ